MPESAFAPLNRRLHRAPVNEQDKTTIVSIFPRPVHSLNFTIFPGDFVVPAGSYDKPGILVVGPSSWWKDMEDLSQDPFEVTVGSLSVANSIVKDWMGGLFGCDMQGSAPGVFYLNGELNLITIKKDHKGALDLALAKQRKYYQTLVEYADSLWVRSQGNPKSISDDMRLAAQELQVKDKPWMKDFTNFSLQECPACGQLRNPNYPVCPNCKAVIDKEKAKALGLAFGA
jgi:hypothetical protein